jgi:hypothetical protein
MIEIKTENKPVTIKIYVCDICLQKHEHPSSIRTCYICRKDICYRGNCSIWFEPSCNLTYPTFDGDYPAYMCRECWEKGKSFREQIQAIRDKAENGETTLWEEWKNTRKAELH